MSSTPFDELVNALGCPAPLTVSALCAQALARIREQDAEIEDKRVEILELSAFTKLSRDAASMLADETADVVVTRLLAEIARAVENYATMRQERDAARAELALVREDVSKMARWIDQKTRADERLLWDGYCEVCCKDSGYTRHVSAGSYICAVHTARKEVVMIEAAREGSTDGQ